MAKKEGMTKYYMQDGELDVTRLVIVTAVKTAYRVFVFATLLFVFFLAVFPMQATNFYDSVGMKDHALKMIDKSIAREKKKDDAAFSKYADGLYYKMLLSEELYLESGGKNAEGYLNSILSSTNDFMSITTINQRYARMDKENLASMPPFAHANVFSIKERVSVLNYFALSRLGRANEFMLGENWLEIEDISFLFEIIDKDALRTDFLDNASDPILGKDISLVLALITECIRFNTTELSSLEAFNSKGMNKDNFIALMDVLRDRVSDYEEFAFEYIESFNGDFETVSELYARQTQLYLVRNIGRLYDYMQVASVALMHDVEEWEELSKIDISEEDDRVTVMEYYINTMLTEYQEYYYSISE